MAAFGTRTSARATSTTIAIGATAGSDVAPNVGRFSYFLDDERWEWSDAVARIHGYEPGTITVTTELVLSHKHPDDRSVVRAILDRVHDGEPFSSRHRIIDTRGRVRTVVVVGDRLADDSGKPVGTTGFYIDVTDVLETDVTEKLETIADSRAEIEQAKGMLMLMYGIGAERAFEVLAWQSQETNIKVRDLARRLVAELRTVEMSPATRAAADHVLLTLEQREPAPES